jgi:O-antigen/teichoic acid export membrane protein
VNDRHYLISVLGLSAIPRIVTFCLTAVSFPLMVRALGADKYGIMVYLVSIFSFLELFISFSISSAAGKGIAFCRIERAHCLYREVIQWARLQFIVAIITILPVFYFGYLFIINTGTKNIDPILFLVVGGTVVISIAVTFSRVILQAILAFKITAVLDTVDSVARSAGWFAVAFVFPTVIFLALAGLITSILTCLIGVGMLVRTLGRNKASNPDNSIQPSKMPMMYMLKESWSFMGLTLGTRTFQTLPLILIGRMLGFEVIGTIGTFTKIVEILALPFTIVGNALMVRAQEIKNCGIQVMNRYWDLLFRFGVLATIITGAFLLITYDAATILLPSTHDATQLFMIMTLLILFRSVSDLVAPASDYVGGLRSRMVFLLFCALVQLPVIWSGIRLFGEVGAVTAMVGSYSLTVIGYIVIAKRVFFGYKERYRPAKDIVMAFTIVLISIGFASFITSSTKIGIAVYVLILSVSFICMPSLRKQFTSGRFLRFDLIRNPVPE